MARGSRPAGQAPGRSAPRGARGRAGRPAGFTLVEILAALAVLAIALAAILGLLYGSMRTSHAASDRDAAAIFTPQAVRDIAAGHLIYADAAHPEWNGLYVETVDFASSADRVSDRDYGLMADLVASEAGSSLSVYPRRGHAPLFAAGLPYRMKYRLERHEDSAKFPGLYVLTLTCCRDQGYIDSGRQDLNARQLVQVAEPVAALVRKK